MADGSGIKGVFPPLAESDYLNQNVDKPISAVVNGLHGEIVVNGVTSDGVMPSQNFNDEEVANVITFVLNNFGNDGGVITPEQVAAIRE
jgi:nitrite reductase (NO-forming)